MCLSTCSLGYRAHYDQPDGFNRSRLSAKVIKLSVVLVRKVHVGQWDRVSNGTVTIRISQSASRSYRPYHLSCGHLFEMSIITAGVSYRLGLLRGTRDLIS